MDNLTLIQRFSDPELMQQMSTSDKIAGALVVTLLGMMITFVVLCILWGLISIMTKALYQPEKKAIAPSVQPQPQVQVPVNEANDTVNDGEDENLIAVITAAVAASMQRPIQTIIVKNIKRTSDRTPAWANVAKHEQLDSRRF